MKRCKHENAVGYMWRSSKYRGMGWDRAFTQPGKVGHHDRITCQDCGEWLSLGPSNDKSWRVRMEREAARIAAEAVNDWPSFDEGIGVEIGWEAHQVGSTEGLRSVKRWAGYLARCIHAHQESEES